MQFSRLTVAIVAGVVGVSASFAAQAVFKMPAGRSQGGVLLGAGAAVFWVADALGVLAPPYREPTLDLRGSPDHDKDHAAEDKTS